MIQTVEAILENGVLRPLSRLDLPEHSRVYVSVTDQGQEAGPTVEDAELTLAEFESLLNELATEGHDVPGTFPRAEIYSDHY